MAAHRVLADLLRLEVTESAIMSDPERALDVLGRLRDAGVAIAVDDFGAGYTSLSQLKSLPVDELQIDRSFVSGLDTDSADALIVRSMVELGHNLGLAVVAEGVETQAAMEELTRYGCDVVQGFYLARPLESRLGARAGARWPQLTGIAVRHRGNFTYVDGVLPDGTTLKLCRLRYVGSAHDWGFAIYRASHGDYADSVFPTGSPVGPCQDALDLACGLYLGEPFIWTQMRHRTD